MIDLYMRESSQQREMPRAKERETDPGALEDLGLPSDVFTLTPLEMSSMREPDAGTCDANLKARSLLSTPSHELPTTTLLQAKPRPHPVYPAGSQLSTSSQSLPRLSNVENPSMDTNPRSPGGA